MRFTVVWTTAALSELVDVWGAAGDRDAISAAADEIDRLLGTDPDQKGMPYFGDRMIVVPPMHAVYVVIPDDMLARVTSVWVPGA